jgi:addiction module RelE/StbE family toxin
VKVRYTPGALQDLAVIADYLRPKSPAGAKRVAVAIEALARHLSKYPLSGRAQDLPGVRKGVVQPWGYVLYYRVDAAEGTITVLAVMHLGAHGRSATGNRGEER